MHLSCNKCKHEWDEETSGSAVMVQCPECYAVVPLVLAKAKDAKLEASAPAAESPTVILNDDTEPLERKPRQPPLAQRPVKRQAPPPDIHEQKTVREMPKADPDDFDEPTGTSPTIVDKLPGHRKPDSRPVSGYDKTATSLAKEPDSDLDEFDTDGSRSGKTETDPLHGERGRPSASRDFSAASPKDVDLSGQTIGGYEVRSMLGAGGMGAVCLARQISLDRDVALKILPGRYATHHDFLVRFTREALSAAQLNHHNVVQVHDVGNDGDIHYISMEYVRGESLGDMVRRDGALQPDDAAGYVLQAARGLKYAHERGIVHRDVKPDNLMVNEHGIVKVADMGLAKMRGRDKDETRPAGYQDPSVLAKARGDLTLTDVAMGTPAYMAPEQARDATNVDARADQYSLGCTLYYLCAGKPPYSGSSALEIISQHQQAPAPNLAEHMRTVPGAMNSVLSRMLAKDPEDRYPTLAEAIQDLEAVLGVDSEKGPYTPREKHLAILEKAQEVYNSVPARKLCRLTVLAFLAVTALLATVFLFLGMPALAGGFVGLLVLTPVFSFILDGILHRTYLFRRVRSVFFGMPVVGWVKFVAGVILALAVLFALHLLPYWIGAAVLGAGLAAVFQLKLVGSVRTQRAGALDEVRAMMKQLRLRGVSEDALQDFACRFGGPLWEEMFEELFGYEAMVLARGRWAATDRLNPRKRFATWRDPIARWLLTVEEERKAARDRKQLARVEAQRLKAEGASDKEAKARAEKSADKMLSDIKLASKILEPKARKSRKADVQSIWDLVMQAFRLALGIAVIILFATVTYGKYAPAAVQSVVVAIQSAPFPAPVRSSAATWFGAAAGIALLISSFSWRRVATSLVLAGAVMILASGYILPHAAGKIQYVDNFRYMAAAGGIMLFGLMISILAKVGGGRF